MRLRKILIVAVAAVLVFAFFKSGIISFSGKKAETAAVIGGADGSTEVLVAGKNGGNKTVEYTQITMEEAKKIFGADNDSGYVILDVRRADEYADGHIPGAINVANETIGTDEIAELPDRNQVIYVYCRSGRRSKEAAAKLSALGYTNIIEFGGIIDWTGDME